MQFDVTNFGADSRLVSIKRAIAFAESIVGIIDNPTSWKNWVSSLASLLLEISMRLVRQSPAFEIRHLRPELHAPEKLDMSVDRLFRA